MTTDYGQEATMASTDITDASVTSDLDSFFRSIPADWYDDEAGDVEAPSGWFGRVTIDDAFRASWVLDGHDIVPAPLANDTYLVQISSSGLVWAWCGTGTNEYWAALDEEYARWLDD